MSIKIKYKTIPDGVRMGHSKGIGFTYLLEFFYPPEKKYCSKCGESHKEKRKQISLTVELAEELKNMLIERLRDKR